MNDVVFSVATSIVILNSVCSTHTSRWDVTPIAGMSHNPGGSPECTRVAMYSLRSRGAASLSQPLEASSFGGRKRSRASQKGGAVGTKTKKKDTVKVEYEEDSSAVIAEDSSHLKLVGVAGATCWEPPRWREQLQNVRTMRDTRDAPVDTVGCSRLADRTHLPEVSLNVLVAFL